MNLYRFYIENFDYNYKIELSFLLEIKNLVKNIDIYNNLIKHNFKIISDLFRKSKQFVSFDTTLFNNNYINTFDNNNIININKFSIKKGERIIHESFNNIHYNNENNIIFLNYNLILKNIQKRSIINKLLNYFNIKDIDLDNNILKVINELNSNYIKIFL